MKVAFAGPNSLISPFKFLGTGIIDSDNKTIEEIKKEIGSSDFAIVFVFENIYKELLKFDSLISSPRINVVPVPGIEGSKGYGAVRIREIVKKAVGMDIGGL